MRRRPSGAFVLPGTLLAVLLLLGSVGCAQVSVQRVEDQRNAPSAIQSISSTPAVEVHDLAVTAVDFDPPLDSTLAKAVDHVSLLAVVENRGNRPADGVSVHAQLFGIDGNEPLLETATTIEHLVPGESKVVQFHELPSIPVTSVYRLTISARALNGEKLTGDNTRTYRIELSSAAR